MCDYCDPNDVKIIEIGDDMEKPDTGISVSLCVNRGFLEALVSYKQRILTLPTAKAGGFLVQRPTASKAEVLHGLPKR